MLNLITPTVRKACLAFLLLCTEHPFWRNLLPFGILHRLKVSWKCVLMKSENMSTLVLPSYCSHKLTPFWWAIATMKYATLPPKPAWDPLAVQWGYKPLFVNHHAIVCMECTWSWGLYLCWNPAASMLNEIPSSQNLSVNILVTLRTSLRLFL